MQQWVLCKLSRTDLILTLNLKKKGICEQSVLVRDKVFSRPLVGYDV